MKQLIVVSAGLSTPSTTRHVADQIAAAVRTQVTARGEDLRVRTVEVRDYAQDLTQLMLTSIDSPALEALKRVISQADGLVAVSPVFQGSYSGLFKMLFDALHTDALNAMPTIIAATGGSQRHALVTEYALRPLLTYLHAHVVPTSLFAATADFGSDGGDEGAALTQRIERAARELAELMLGRQTGTRD
ncbi:CE1759 family FMN reductase [Corynebacterium sp. p3-SID1056]|uniref:CE1759 family FMN reductase n=1 Tax=Corynebacterium sp. p3-SID1056 TaxID=2916092 RepID=UPI0021A8237F|nr:CE1759 family FMN reductase [Corynebacterium sp. p3-SID1056]MCT2338920.1 NAD(P)H-dependent oxidoreductase [Corynebacterium sp. p3-SID1056]